MRILIVWNGFNELYDDKDPRMNDYDKSCKPKNSTEDFQTSNHNLIYNLRSYGVIDFGFYPRL
jgi:hypothetical protein